MLSLFCVLVLTHGRDKSARRSTILLFRGVIAVGMTATVFLIGGAVGIIRSPNRASILPDQSSPGSVWLRAG
jgi:hypothetical protein